jgi:hypothetical protein
VWGLWDCGDATTALTIALSSVLGACTSLLEDIVSSSLDWYVPRPAQMLKFSRSQSIDAFAAQNRVSTLEHVEKNSGTRPLSAEP